MKNLAFLFFTLLISTVAMGQLNKISEKTIWDKVYPNNNKFDKSKRLITQVRGSEEQYRKELLKVLYYKSGVQLIAKVIFNSHRYMKYGNEDYTQEMCNTCFSTIEIATFYYSNGNWILKDHKKEIEALGFFGQVSIKFYKKKRCLFFNFWSRDSDNDYDDFVYYDIQTLKKIKTITTSKKITY